MKILFPGLLRRFIILLALPVAIALPPPGRAHSQVPFPKGFASYQSISQAEYSGKSSSRSAEKILRVSSNPYLELSVEPAFITPGGLFTLHITYHNIGMPYTAITINPPGLVAYDPQLSMPCKYYEHPNGCTAITFRALGTGVVTFTASANGEIYDEGCGCWYWGSGTSLAPATVSILDGPWKLFLPVIQRSGWRGDRLVTY
jgi:hypothetical protein